MLTAYCFFLTNHNVPKVWWLNAVHVDLAPLRDKLTQIQVLTLPNLYDYMLKSRLCFQSNKWSLSQITTPFCNTSMDDWVHRSNQQLIFDHVHPRGKSLIHKVYGNRLSYKPLHECNIVQLCKCYHNRTRVLNSIRKSDGFRDRVNTAEKEASTEWNYYRICSDIENLGLGDLRMPFLHNGPRYRAKGFS